MLKSQFCSIPDLQLIIFRENFKESIFLSLVGRWVDYDDSCKQGWQNDEFKICTVRKSIRTYVQKAYFKNLTYRNNVTYQKQILHPYRTYVLFIGWYVLNAPYLKGTVRRSIKGRYAQNAPYLRGTVST